MHVWAFGRTKKTKSSKEQQLQLKQMRSFDVTLVAFEQVSNEPLGKVGFTTVFSRAQNCLVYSEIFTPKD